AQSASPSVDDEVWSNMRRDRVRSALAVLPEQQREALALAYFGGFTQREIAGLTATPLGTVKTRMLAGMRRLRTVLEGPLREGVPGGDHS
ncbi:MAG: sigma-70 family RNA polymerase sigma factor, partial [Mycobacteriales bacterium]